MMYEVQALSVCDGWGNCWHDDGELVVDCGVCRDDDPIHAGQLHVEVIGHRVPRVQQHRVVGLVGRRDHGSTLTERRPEPARNRLRRGPIGGRGGRARQRNVTDAHRRGAGEDSEARDRLEGKGEAVAAIDRDRDEPVDHHPPAVECRGSEVVGQRDDAVVQHDPVAGAGQVIETYQLIRTTDLSFRMPEVDKLVDLQTQGKLKEYVEAP